MNDAPAAVQPLAPSGDTGLIGLALRRHADHDLMRTAPGSQFGLSALRDHSDGSLGAAFGQLEGQVARTRGGAVPQPELRARDSGRAAWREWPETHKQRETGTDHLPEQPPRWRAVGDAAKPAEILRANL